MGQSASPIGRVKLQGRSVECKIERQNNGKVREREEEQGRRVFSKSERTEGRLRDGVLRR
jgi:hypothetical protein